MTATAKQPTCEEQIDSQLAQRCAMLMPDLDRLCDPKDFQEIAEWHGIELDDLTKDPLKDDDDREAFVDDSRRTIEEELPDRIAEGILSIETTTTYKILLSWGGPSDGFDLEWDKDQGWIGGSYWFKDWFDGARHPLDGGQAEEWARVFGIYPEEGV